MQCGCSISSGWGDASDALFSKEVLARKTHWCCVCGRAIRPGEKYQRDVAVWDGTARTFKICLDCSSVIAAYFCTYQYGAVWEELFDQIRDAPEEYLDSRVAKLTPTAKAKVLEALQREIDKED